MRLYLSSFHLGDHPEQLVALMAGGRAIAVIANACDGAPPEIRADAVRREIDDLALLGLEPVEVDLRAYPEAGDLLARFGEFDALWVRGGNSFVLRAVMQRSGADEAVLELLARDALVYAGYSAGPCMLTPSLHGIELVDPVDEVRTVCGVEPIWDGLGVLSYAFVPHVNSPGHPETDDCDQLRARYERDGVPHRALRDGQVLIIDGDETTLL